MGLLQNNNIRLFLQSEIGMLFCCGYRNREDTVRCIVSSLTEDSNSDLMDELIKGQPLSLDESYRIDSTQTDAWKMWTPDPVDADPGNIFFILNGILHIRPSFIFVIIIVIIMKRTPSMDPGRVLLGVQLLLPKLAKDCVYQTTQPTSGETVTAVTNCRANCIDTSRSQQWEPDLLFLGKPAMLLIKTGDVETNPGPSTTHKQVWIYDICHKQIHGRKQISISCNRIEHWVHLRCAGTA